jgi:N-ethylmaleimide reductase
MQLWHVGRISHTALQPNGNKPVAPSAIKPEGAKTFISADSGMVDVPEPRALEAGEMADIVEQYRQGALNAKAAGFDGVEVHAANGYLLDQFLKSGSNHRSDEFGGSVENRMRLPLMVIEAVIDVWGKGNVGVRVSPTGSFNAMYDEDPVETFGEFAKRLNDLGISYIEVVEDSFQGNHANGRPESVIDAIQAGFHCLPRRMLFSGRDISPRRTLSGRSSNGPTSIARIRWANRCAWSPRRSCAISYANRASRWW